MACWRVAVLAVAAAWVAFAPTTGAASGRWLAGDLHTHSYLSDGWRTFDDVAGHALSEYGLDYIGSADHGGRSRRDADGKPLETPLWRWLSLRDLAYPMVQDARWAYSRRGVILGLEWNAPTHEHVGVGIVGGEHEPGGIWDVLPASTLTMS